MSIRVNLYVDGVPVPESDLPRYAAGSVAYDAVDNLGPLTPEEAADAGVRWYVDAGIGYVLNPGYKLQNITWSPAGGPGYGVRGEYTAATRCVSYSWAWSGIWSDHALQPEEVVVNLYVVTDEDSIFTVETDHQGNGKTTPASQQVVSGGTCTVSATPENGWAFVAWTCSDGSVSTEREHSFRVFQDQTWTAHFQVPEQGEGVSGNLYSVQALVDGDVGGTATHTHPGRLYYYGESCTVSATPDDGYAFVCWIGSDGSVVARSSHTFTVKRDTKWTAFFTKTDDPEFHHVITRTQGGGSVSGGGIYRVGDSYTVSASMSYTDEDGVRYEFDRWTCSDGRTYTSASVDGVMGRADVTYTAHYKVAEKFRVRVKQKAISAFTSVSCDINTTVTGTGEYCKGDTCRLKATPESGAKLLLFYTEGATERWFSGAGAGEIEFEVEGDTDVYALSLFETTKLFYDVWKVKGDGTKEDAPESDVEVSGGLDAKGSPGSPHRVGDEFTATATLKADDKLYALADTWIVGVHAENQLRQSSMVLDVSSVSGQTAACKVKGDCQIIATARLYGDHFSNPGQYFLEASYVAAYVYYLAGTYTVSVSARYYQEQILVSTTFEGAAKSSGGSATYECGTKAKVVLSLSARREYDPGWSFLVRSVLMDGEQVASGICRVGASDTVELDTDAKESGDYVAVDVLVWHENDGKVLCNSEGAVVCNINSTIESR